MASTHDFGRFCEDLACTALVRDGWRVLHRNFRLGHKEIDLIVRRGATVAFVEVKGRSGPAFGHPLEAVTASKRREIERVALHWIRWHGRAGEAYRFDAIAVIRRPGRAAVVEHVEDAWRV
jgi:putative endonuclease